MTERTEKSLVEEYEETDDGTQDLAAANLASQVIELIRKALEASDLDQRALAEKLGVSEGRVSQVVNGDGNLRIAAVARYLRALGYSARISAQPVDPHRPELPPRSRRHDSGSWATWSRVGHSDVARHLGFGSMIPTLLQGPMDKAMLAGIGLANIGWTVESTFIVGLNNPIRMFGVGEPEGRVDDPSPMSAESHTGHRR